MKKETLNLQLNALIGCLRQEDIIPNSEHLLARVLKKLGYDYNVRYDEGIRFFSVYFKDTKSVAAAFGFELDKFNSSNLWLVEMFSDLIIRSDRNIP